MKHAAVYAALIALLAATYGVSFFDLGAGNFVLNVAIAVAKALLVAAFFMKIGTTPLARSALLVSLALLATLYWLAADDYLTRPPSAEPATRLILDSR
ncbi:MAG TPA: cytochrome C oxidase subunit IV family protein [Gammaproteobacteria bacterium]|jgi:cytochrome c oxidase subunit 4|nr:cytochrome C oxidase subunit IV family protein [Gammaproteobacteria bacterium]